MNIKEKKINFIKFVLIVCIFTTIIILSVFFIPNLLGRSKFVNEISKFANKCSIFSLSKIYCYSSASGINSNEGKAMWNVDVSQYTDMALYLKINNVNQKLTNELLAKQNTENSNLQIINTEPKYTITKIYIDNIIFSNNTGTLSLFYIPILNFGKLTENCENKINKIDFNILDNNKILLDTNNIIFEPSIDKNLILPITLRYLNYNIKTNYSITNINENLSFDGSILKRALVPLSSIKNKVSFTIHIINKLAEEYIYPIDLQIPLQNKDNSKNIYDGNYSEIIKFDNCYFY